MSDFVFAAFADEAGAALSEQIDAMLENRVPLLEIRGVDGKNVTALTVEEAKEVRKRLDDAGLAVWSMGSPIGKIGIRDAFGPHLDLFRHTLDLAEILGAKAFRLFSFYSPAGEDPELYRDEVLERMERFTEAGKGSGILLCHENEKGIYGDVADRCRAIHENLPGVGAVFDPANYIQTGENTLEAWEKVEKYVKYMHIKDALSSGGVVPPGRGEGHVEEIAKQYMAQGGTRFTIEPHLWNAAVIKTLENGEQTSVLGEKYIYRNSDEAFDAAVQSFRALIGA